MESLPVRVKILLEYPAVLDTELERVRELVVPLVDGLKLVGVTVTAVTGGATFTDLFKTFKP